MICGERLDPIVKQRMGNPTSGAVAAIPAGARESDEMASRILSRG